MKQRPRHLFLRPSPTLLGPTCCTCLPRSLVVVGTVDRPRQRRKPLWIGVACTPANLTFNLWLMQRSDHGGHRHGPCRSHGTVILRRAQQRHRRSGVALPMAWRWCKASMPQIEEGTAGRRRGGCPLPFVGRPVGQCCNAVLLMPAS